MANDPLTRLQAVLEARADADAHARQVALMKWLSAQAKRLGVGEHAYVVGGAVRNWKLGKAIKDVDIAIDSVALGGRDAAWFASKLVARIPGKANLTTNQYGVAIITVKDGWTLDGVDMAGEVIEIATARKESYGGEAGKGYKPDAVEPATAADDIYRREFTVNTLMWKLASLAQGPDKAEIVDLTGCGLKDLQKGVLRCPSDPDKTFRDDPSRMLRAVKFITKYGFVVDDETGAAIRRNARSLSKAPPDAIASILIDTLLSNHAEASVKELKRLGLLDVLAGLVKSHKPFESRLRRWAERQDPEMIFVLRDMGLPVSVNISGLGPKDEKALRLALKVLGPKHSPEFMEAMRQPSKALKDKRAFAALAAEAGYEPSGFRKFAPKFQAAVQQALLADPRLVRDSKKLLAAVRAALV